MPRGTRLFVPAAAEPWPVAGPRFAAVCSYGVGGTNAHVLVEEPPPAATLSPSGVRASPLHSFLLSARSIPALEVGSARLADWLVLVQQPPH